MTLSLLFTILLIVHFAIGAVVIVGSDEAARGEVTVKCMQTGEQAAHPMQSTVDAVRNALNP